MVCYAACSYSLHLFFVFSLIQNSFAGMIKCVLFIQVIFKKEKKNNKVAYLRCRKRSLLSTTSIDQHLQHIKLNPGVQTGLGSKLLQHSSFPSKPLVTTCNCGASDKLREPKAPSHCSRTILSYHGCLLNIIPTLKSLRPLS